MEQPEYSAYTRRFGNYVAFKNVTFSADPGVTTGYYIQPETVARGKDTSLPALRQYGAHMVSTKIEGCNCQDVLDYVILASRAGRVTVRGGNLTANKAVVSYSNDTDHFHHLFVAEMGAWEAPYVFRLPSSINPTTGGVSRLTTSGAFDAEVMELLDSEDVNEAVNVEWQLAAVALVDSDPNGRIRTAPGMVARTKIPAIGSSFEYMNSYTAPKTETAYGHTEWRATA